MSKRINLMLDDEIMALLTDIQVSKGYDDIPATLRAIIRLHGTTQVVSVKETPAKSLKQRKYTDEQISAMIAELEKKGPFSYCPIHGNSFVSTCHCLSKGLLVNYYKEIYE